MICMKIQKILIISAIILLGSGCTSQNTTKDKQEKPPVSKAVWEKTSLGTVRFECAEPECLVKMIVYRFPKDGFVWRFENTSAPLTVLGHLNANPKAVFAINGVYFNEKYLPTGFLKTNGQIVGKNKYELNKSAVLALAPEFKIINTAQEKFDEAKISEAGQSYPLLIAAGVEQKVATEKKARRSFVGEDTQGNIYFGIIPDNEVTLAEAAAMINKIGVPWNNVLNLDGGPSSGLASIIPKSIETINSIVQVPSVIIAEKK